MSNLKRSFICGVALSAISASAVTTNVWKGAASGGTWRDQANWTEPLTPTVATVYDFSKLEDGAKVVNDYVCVKTSVEQLRIEGLIFGENKGTITLEGTSDSETIFSKKSFFDVPSGTIFDCRLRHTIGPWLDSNAELSFNLPGTVRFFGDSFKPTLWNFSFKSLDSSIVFDNVGETFILTKLTFMANRITVTVNGDATFADVYDGVWPNAWMADASRIIGDGDSALTISSGYGYGVNLDSGNCRRQSYAMITNFHSVVFSGGGGTHSRSPIHAKRYVFRNFDLDYGREYTRQQNFVNNRSGAIQLIPQAAVDLDGSARVRTYCDQILSTLSGTGTHGSFDVGGTWNNETEKIITPGSLTVGEGVDSPTSTVFNARLTGIGRGFVKKGTGYDLTLTGSNTYTGDTTVAEGRLVLKKPVSYGDAAWWWSFDGEDQTLPKSGSSKLKLQFLQEGKVRPVADGVRATQAVHLDGQHSAVLLDTRQAVISGDEPYTIQFWIRPDRSGCCTTGARLSYIFDYGTEWAGDFTRSRVVLYRKSEVSDDYSLIFTPTNYNYTEVVEGMGVNVQLKGDDIFDGKWHHVAYVYGRESRLVEAYLDGVLKGTDVLSSDMNHPDDAKIRIGFSDKDSDEYYTGDIDEMKVMPQALSADEILKEFVFAAPQECLTAPTPIIHWTFADGENIGGDMCNVAPLAGIEGQTAPSLSAAAYAIDGLALEKNCPMRTANYPECMPTGNQPFTVSCRYLSNGSVGNSPILWWGNPDVANGYFRIQTSESNLRSPAVGYANMNSLGALWNGFSYANPKMHHTTAVTANCDIPSAWTDFTVSYDNVSRKLKMYVDGTLVGEKSDVILDVKKMDALHVGYQTIDKNGEKKTTYFQGMMDDIQIFNRTLSDDEVRLVVRKMHGETVGRVIANSPVTVASGATLAFEGPAHSLQSLSAESGTIHIAQDADFTPNAGDLSVGALIGRGLLNLPEGCDFYVSDASGFGGTVRLAGGAGFAMSTSSGVMSADVYAESGAVLNASAPIRTTGRAVIPAAVTVVLPQRWPEGESTISLLVASDVIMGDVNWLFKDSDGLELDVNDYRVIRSDSGLAVKKRKGTVVVFR